MTIESKVCSSEKFNRIRLKLEIIFSNFEIAGRQLTNVRVIVEYTLGDCYKHVKFMLGDTRTQNQS